MSQKFTLALERAGVDTTRRPSEIVPSLAKDEIYHAQVNCELQKARSTVRALMIVKHLKKERSKL